MEFDLESIGSAFKIAASAGDATGKIAKGVDSVKSLLKGSEVAGDADLKSALGELTMQIANAKVAHADLILKLTTLQNELAEHKAFVSDLDRYQLWETPAGAIVYRLHQQADPHEPIHYLCPNCIETKRKSILQGHSKWRKCPACKTGFDFEVSSEAGFGPISKPDMGGFI